MKFSNKVVVITGAAGGIGTEITKRFLNFFFPTGSSQSGNCVKGDPGESFSARVS